jgi:signal transduction histidine kinase
MRYIYLKQLSWCEFIQKLSTYATSSSQSKDIEISLSIPDDHIIAADKNMLETVLRNVVSNAIKFTPSKGQISLSSSMNDEGVTKKN